MLEIISLHDSDIPAVQVNVSLSGYLDACRALIRERVENRESLAVKKIMMEEKEKLINLVAVIYGDLNWRNIKKDLLHEMKDDARIRWEQYLTDDKIHSGENVIPCEEEICTSPLVLEVLNRYFTEILKNSIDAFIQRYIEAEHVQHLSKTLMMKISLEEKERNVVITIEDNAGGFPADYLEMFPGYLLNKTYQAPAPSQKENSEYYLGGQGKGMALLFSLLLDGVGQSSEGKRCKEFDVAEETSRVMIGNTSKGAQIILSSLKTPAKPCEQSFSPSYSSLHSPISLLKVTAILDVDSGNLMNKSSLWMRRKSMRSSQISSESSSPRECGEYFETKTTPFKLENEVDSTALPGHLTGSRQGSTFFFFDHCNSHPPTPLSLPAGSGRDIEAFWPSRPSLKALSADGEATDHLSPEKNDVLEEVFPVTSKPKIE